MTLVVIVLGQPRTTTAQAGSLALVYLDSLDPASGELWVTSLDGSSKQHIATLPHSTRPLDVRGSRLALDSDNDLRIFDLASGTEQRVTVGPRLATGLFGVDGSFYFTTYSGCEFGPNLVLGKIDAATGERADIATFDRAHLNLAGQDSTTGDLIAVPRGCDVGVSQIVKLDAQTGAETAAITARGCGWVSISPAGQHALVESAACSGPGYPPMSVYDLGDGSMRQVTFDQNRPSHFPFVYAPDGGRAAYGLALAQDAPPTRPGSAKSGGIWLLDTQGLTRTKLWQDQGAESWAIAWSPDGAKLVVASVEAQGQCGYYVLDVASGEATQVADVGGCGVNGTMVGFATLP